MKRMNAEEQHGLPCVGCGNDVEEALGLCPWCAPDLIEVQPAWVS